MNLAHTGKRVRSGGRWRAPSVVAIATAACLLSSSAPALAAEVVQGTLVQMIHTSAFSPSSPDPSAIVYIPGADRFLIGDSEVDEMTLYQGYNLFTATRNGSGTGTGTTLAFSKEPTGLGINLADGTLYVSDDDGDRVSVVRPGLDGVHGTPDDIWTRFSTATFGSTDPEGIEYDAATGHVFVCDGVGLEIYDIDPVNAVFGDGNDVVTSFDLARYSARDCEGLGLDRERGTLLAVDPSRKWILELTRSGDLVRTIDLSTIPTTNRNFAGVTLAPTSNPNDSPSAMNYWVVDRQVDNGADPNENDGKLYEVSIPSTDPPPPPPPPPPTASFTYSCTNLACAFDASSSTAGDGTITGYAWDFSDGTTGSGVSVSHTYASAGTYTTTLTVTNSGGATDQEQMIVTVTSAGGGITLAARGYKVKGIQHADLSWSGATSDNVDVYRNGAFIAVTANDGTHDDNIRKKGGGSYTYKVCEAGTNTCSNDATIIF